MSDIFTEGFELVISGQDDDEYNWEKEEYRPEYLDKVANVLSELGVSKEQVKFEGTGVGVGAESNAVAWIITGLTLLFLAGKKINENVDAWIELSKRVRKVLRKLKPDYVSQPFAAAIALDEVSKADPKIRKIDPQSAFIHIVPNPSMDMTGSFTHDNKPVQEVFRYQPMRYYTFVLRAYSNEAPEGYWANVPSAIHIICIRSNGKIEFHHILPVRDWEKFEGFESE